MARIACVGALIGLYGLAELQPLPLTQTAVIVSYAFVFSLVINDIVKLALLTRVRPSKHLLR